MSIESMKQEPPYRAVKTVHEGKPIYVSEPAEPVQEPVCQNKVCWTPYDCDDGCKSLKPCATPPAAQEEIQRLSALVRAQQITIDKLETQRQWVGLDAADWNDFNPVGATPQDVAAWAEAKLREKNGGQA